jgi:Cu/Ag efflux pump CusA
MAVVIIGGLVTSTLLNLFVLPSFYLRFARSWTRHGSILSIPEGGVT